MPRAERIHRLRQRRAQAGLKRIDLYVPEDKVDELRLYARRLMLEQLQSRCQAVGTDIEIEPRFFSDAEDEALAIELPPVRSRGADRILGDAPRPDGAGGPPPAVAGNAREAAPKGLGVAGGEDGGTLATAGRGAGAVA